MTFYLKQMVLMSPGQIEICAAEYRRLLRCRNNLLQIVYLEEKFDVLLGNFVELETDLLSIAARDMIFRMHKSYERNVERNFVINRRLLNLLSACRAYLDQGIHDVGAITFLDNDDVRGIDCSIKQRTQEWYGHSQSYRIMDAIRNYVQHRGFPTATIYDRRTVDTKTGLNFAFCSIPQFALNLLKADKKFKKSVLDGIKEDTEYLDAMPLVREYIEALSVIHIQTRHDVEDIAVEAEEVISSFILRYISEFGPQARVGLAAIDVQHECVETETYLTQDIAEYRKMLIRKNSGLENLSKRFVTGGRLPISQRIGVTEEIGED